MTPKPYSERVAEPLDFSSLSPEAPNFPIQVRDDTPSPRSPPLLGSTSPPLTQDIQEVRPLIPLLSGDDGLPYDYTLPEFLRQVSGQRTLSDILAMSLRVFTEAASLQQMTLHTPNLRELNLEGSALTSLRDIGSELTHLHVLRVGRCHLISLDGAIGLTNLRELHAPGNAITSAAPCSHLAQLRLLDLSRNRLHDIRSLTFLTRCRNLRCLRVVGNPIGNQDALTEFVRATLPALEYLDDTQLTPQPENTTRQASASAEPAFLTSPRVFERTESSTSGSSRVSSASSSSGATFLEPDQHPISGSEEAGESAISRFTSGQFACGNFAAMRRRPADSQNAGTSSNTAALAASRRWRAAYRRFRELNSQRWEKESQDDSLEPE